MPLSLEALADARRPLILRIAGLAGSTRNLALRAGRPLVAVAVVGIVVFVQPENIGPLPATLLAVAASGLMLRWLIRARRRVVVDDFLVYPKDEAKAGLATLLIAELGRLQQLYGRVNDELSTSPSVAVTGRGGSGRGTQPGAFLSVTADDVEQTLKDAVATEAAVSFGGIKIPIGFIVSVVGRLARGPRVTGSLHSTDGGLVLTAQIAGPGRSFQWRVDAPADAGGDLHDRMIAELAIRMFNDLTLRGSVRWRAIRAFTEHLDLYWQSYRTPRDRALKLEQAEGKLLEAIAEDEGFDLAYYNLGVVYSQLADTELAAAQKSDYLKPEDRPRRAYDARLEASLVAFNRAVALNRDRAEAVYALAVHEFTRLKPGDRDALEAIVCRCERVLELEPCHAQAHELMGVARIKLGENGEQSLRTAVRHSWRRLWSVELRERSAPPTVESRLPGARANLAADLTTLAQFNYDRADGDARRLARADRLFRRAGRLASGDTKAAVLLAHGQMLEQLGRAEEAAGLYHTALKIDPENPVYWAHLAAAYAAQPRRPGQDPANFAEGALNHLAPIYRRILEPHPPKTAVPMRDHTLGALSRVHASLGDREGSSRIAGLVTLGYELEKATREQDTRALRRLKDRYGEDRAWEREQVMIALARKLRRLEAWTEAAEEYEELIALLERHRPDGLVQHSLRSKHAGALREQGKLEPALVAAAEGELQNPLSACARRELGEAHFALSQFDQALKAWRQTMWLTPNDPYLHLKVGQCHWKVAHDRHDHEARRAALLEAATYFERAALLFGVGALEEWASSQLWAGRVRLELGERDAAVGHLRSAASSETTRAVARQLLEEIQRRQLDFGPQLAAVSA
jgi:tetratricopeptide (TPR) repeat protein